MRQYYFIKLFIIILMVHQITYSATKLSKQETEKQRIQQKFFLTLVQKGNIKKVRRYAKWRKKTVDATTHTKGLIVTTMHPQPNSPAHVELCKYFLAQDVDPNCGALHRASKHGHSAMCKLLVEAGAHLERRDPKFKTPLIHAVKNRQSATVSTLLSLKAMPDNPFLFGVTPLLITLETLRDKKNKMMKQ